MTLKEFFYDSAARIDASSDGSIFLAGPTSRASTNTPWRSQACDLLKEIGFLGTVILPEFGRNNRGSFRARAAEVFLPPVTESVLAWETSMLDTCTVAVFWMPFDIEMPGMTTRCEVSRAIEQIRISGLLCQEQRIVLGMPPNTATAGHIQFHASRALIPVYENLAEVLRVAAARVQLLLRRAGKL